jgi:hypothetical protein
MAAVFPENRDSKMKLIQKIKLLKQKRKIENLKLSLKEADRLMSQNNGNLDLRYTEIRKLPKNLHVKGWLDISMSMVKELPDGLVVDEWLNASDSFLKKISRTIKVEKEINLQNSHIRMLPENLSVNGDLNVAGTPLEKLPENLHVEGNIFLNDSGIEQIPENFSTNGGLYLCGTSIKKLPDNMQIKGSLILAHSAIKCLPQNLRVGENLDISDTGITQIPDDIMVGGIICVELSGRGKRVKRERKLIPEKYGIIGTESPSTGGGMIFILISSVKGRIVAEPTPVTRIRDGNSVLNQLSGGKQPFFCHIVTDGYAGFCFKQVHDIVAGQIKMFGDGINIQIFCNMFIDIIHNIHNRLIVGGSLYAGGIMVLHGTVQKNQIFRKFDFLIK